MTENEIKEEIKELYRKAKVFEDSGYATAGISATFKKSAKIIHNLLTEIQQYRAIGTIEEFKALKEKNEPKRLLTREEKYPQNYGMYSTSDRWCPCCRGLVFTGDWSVHKQNIMYKRIRCGCGQKLDWSE